MVLSLQHIRFLQRLVQDRPTTRLAGSIALYLSSNFSVGVATGRQVTYQNEHFAVASSLLRANELPVRPLAQDARRADAARFGGLSEKAFSAAPHAGSVAVKCIGTCSLDGTPLTTPAGTYMVVTPGVGQRIACERLMLVENLETFRQLETYRWIDYGGVAVLAIYRGDMALSTSAAIELVRTRAEPIWAFVDFDPAGLRIANALPPDRLEKLVLPSWSWLRQAAGTHRGRQLYDAQVPTESPALEGAASAHVRVAWSQMKALRSAVTQERMACARRN